MNEQQNKKNEEKFELFLENLMDLLLDECIEEERIWIELLS